MGMGGDKVGAGPEGIADIVTLSLFGYRAGSMGWQMRIGTPDPRLPVGMA